MASAQFVSPPPTLKTILPYLKVAAEHEQRDPVVTYWCRYYAVQLGLKIDRTSKDSVTFLAGLMDWMEKDKRARKDNEAITADVVAQAHIETYALKLFLWADNEDRAARFNKNVVKAFYTAGIVFDVLTTFGELTDEVVHHRKYAKWKATYIHNCLKSGQTPVPGPLNDEDNEDSSFFAGGASGGPPYPTNITEVGDQDQNDTWPTASDSSAFNLGPSMLVTPGSYAPPSTPSGPSQLSPSSSTTSVPSAATNNSAVKTEDLHKAQKYCKWAGSALQYEDVPTAIVNLEKALQLLKTGRDD